MLNYIMDHRKVILAKPPAYKNVNNSSLQIFNENNLKTKQDIKVEHKQSNKQASAKSS